VPLTKAKKRKRVFLVSERRGRASLRKQKRASRGRKRTVFMIFFKIFDPKAKEDGGKQKK
nr:hypothetical protein [Proteus mirabilis]